MNRLNRIIRNTQCASLCPASPSSPSPPAELREIRDTAGLQMHMSLTSHHQSPPARHGHQQTVTAVSGPSQTA